ncbi:MAG: hypothetical protein NT165_00260 [Candidatus Falkowbacteria bacterium]|nr:hypothetical protein [Candidatus Falkowbacteria bacterium]
MFNKKDYRSYFQQLYQVELTMKQEGKELMALVPDRASKEILKSLVADEIRHAKIVKEMMALI